ncbi:MAG: DUF3267 domain-containing protein [Firmicutes bacterium]|nr:DUF3267 domain-containing protein [Bacillota bacterium]
MAKERKLTEKEQIRLDRFNKVAASMEAQGYRKTMLTVSILWANVFSILLLIAVAAIGIALFFLKNDGIFQKLSIVETVLLFAVFLALIVVHELIHGIGWSLFTKNGFKDIEFGVMLDSLTPYCTCSQPLGKGQYILGAVLPLVTLGILPMIAGIMTGSFYTLMMGVVMTASAAGDILIILKILRYKSKAKDVVYIDHPTEAGGVIFER